jgi:hypothetical protein
MGLLGMLQCLVAHLFFFMTRRIFLSACLKIFPIICHLTTCLNTRLNTRQTRHVFKEDAPGRLWLKWSDPRRLTVWFWAPREASPRDRPIGRQLQSWLGYLPSCQRTDLWACRPNERRFILIVQSRSAAGRGTCSGASGSQNVPQFTCILCENNTIWERAEDIYT